MTMRLVGFPLLLAATACATATTNSRARLEPQNGPRARVYTHFSGGLIDRRVTTTFRADKKAHVVVAHLGGDGRVEILYPESPRQSTLIEGNKTYQVQFNSTYDGVPQLFSYTTRQQRSYGARLASYDGRGNGFVFVIATEYPMFTDALDDHGEWSDSLEADDYRTSWDPRESIRDLAEVLTRGMPYSLDYANAFTTTSFTGFADAAMDCSTMLSAFGTIGTWYNLRMSGAISPWSYFSPFAGMGDYYYAFGGFGAPYAYNGCGYAGFATYPDIWYRYRRYGFVNGGNINTIFQGYRRYGFINASYDNPPWAYDRNKRSRGVVPITTVTVAPTTPEPTKPGGFSTGARRPGYRNGDESGSAFNVTRPRFDGQRNKPATTNWAPPIQATRTTVDRNDHYGRSNGGNSSSGATGVTRTEGVTSHPVASAPVQRSTPAPVSHKVPVVVAKDP